MARSGRSPLTEVGDEVGFEVVAFTGGEEDRRLQLASLDSSWQREAAVVLRPRSGVAVC